MAYFNKEKLLSSISVDEFNLYLPNPEILVDSLIHTDDVETFTRYYCDISYLVNILGLQIHAEYYFIKKLFKQQPFPIKIITFISQIDRWCVSQRNLSENLKKYNIKIDEILSQTKIPIFECFTETLLDLSNEIFIDNLDILISYIKWIIEFMKLMPGLILEEYSSSRGDCIEHVFWHPDKFDIDSYEGLNNNKKYIMETLGNSNQIYYGRIHDSFCKFCKNHFKCKYHGINRYSYHFVTKPRNNKNFRYL